MAEFFELSIITKNRVDLDLWKSNFSFEIGNSSYSGNLKFFRNKEMIFGEYEANNCWEYEISISTENLFSRDSVIEEIILLLEDVKKINDQIEIEFAIGNVETNSFFISDLGNCQLESLLEILLKSALIFVSEKKMNNLEINLYHLIFKKGEMFCLYNPTSGILFSSQNEKYKILKQSFK